MIKSARSPETIRVELMSALGLCAATRIVESVGIEVNWDRPAGLLNWWVTRVHYRSAELPDIAASRCDLSRVEADLQARYFAVDVTEVMLA
jgi:hypothetical protein